MRKKITFLLFMIFISVKTQEKFDLFNVIYRNLTDFTDEKQIYYPNGCVKATKLASFLGANSPWIKFYGGYELTKTLDVNYISICNSEKDTLFYKKSLRYVFINQPWYENESQFPKRLLKDTLQIPISFDFGACSFDAEEKKRGICVGIYHRDKFQNDYFEIYKMYGLSEEGKLQLLPMNTVLFNCNMPMDYQSDEEEGTYHFGVKGGKKLEYDWYKK